MGLYSNISTDSLIKTLRQRLADEEIIEKILDDPDCTVSYEKFLNKIATKIANRDNHGFGAEDAIDAILDVEPVNKDLQKLSPHIIEHLYSRMYERFYDSSIGKWKFERDYLPNIGSVIDILNDNYIGEDPVLDYYDNDDLLEALRGSQELDDWTEEDRKEGYNEGYNDAKEEVQQDLEYQKWALDNFELNNLNPDDSWIWICNQVKCGYYDYPKLVKFFNELFLPKLKKSSFYQIIEKEEETQKDNGKE